jgi:flagellar biosynthesis chaperone FliJ
MKKFVFSLDRVLDLRHAQARTEEVKLERLYAERAEIDARERALLDERRQAETALCMRPGVTGQDLAALDRFLRHVDAEGRRSAEARSACGRQILAQLRIVTLKRRDVKLLEKLKHQRQQSWTWELEREIGQEAEASHLAKWNRENIQ